MEQIFYGWFENEQDKEPAYEPPRDAPCPFCGKPVHAGDVRTHCLMFSASAYAKRSYFYRTHATCSDKGKQPEGDRPQVNMDGFILDMIARNGD